jgi:hypothetical protein
MRFIMRSLSAVGCLLLLPAIHAQDAPKPGLWPAADKPAESDATSLKIIDLNLKARGGAKGLSKIKTLAVEAELIEGKQDYQLQIHHASPDRIRVETTRRHLGDDYITVTAFDGATAWRQETVPEKKNPGRLGGLEQHLLELDAALPFLLAEAREAGTVFIYKGKERFAKRDVYVLHGWLESGFQLDVLIDAESFHVINYRHAFRIGGKEVLVDRAPTGLTRLNGLWFDKGYVFRLGGKAFRELAFDSIKANVLPPEDAFTEPPVKERWLRINR